MAVEATTSVSSQAVTAPVVVTAPATAPVEPKVETTGSGVAQATPQEGQAKSLYVMA